MRARLAAVVAANPWVAGRVVREKGEKLLTLLHPELGTALPDDVMAALVHVDPRGMPALHPAMPYDEMVKAIVGSPAPVPMLSQFSYMLRSEAAAPSLVTRVTLATTGPNSFALLFSMSHVAVDGDGYYRILNMLSEAGTVAPLSATRKHAATPRMIAAQGRKTTNT